MAKERIGAGTDLVATDGTTIGIKTQNGSYTITNPGDVEHAEGTAAGAAPGEVRQVERHCYQKENLAEEMNIPRRATRQSRPSRCLMPRSGCMSAKARGNFHIPMTYEYHQPNRAKPRAFPN